MKSTAKWTGKYRSVVDNGRQHELIIDLPQIQGGDNAGPTALELAIMGFSGCISTVYKILSNKMRLAVDGLEVEIDAIKGMETISKMQVDVKIRSEEDPAKLQNCLDKTLENCPVSVLFDRAGVDIHTSMKVAK